MQGVECRVQGVECRVQDVGCGVSGVRLQAGVRACRSVYRGTSLIRNHPPHRALGMVPLQGPTGWRFLMSEVPLKR